MVDLQATTVGVAPGPQAAQPARSSQQGLEEGGAVGGAGEQPPLRSEVDDRPLAVDDDPAHVPDDRRPHHVGGMQCGAVDAVAPPVLERLVRVDLDVLAGRSAQLLLERLLVDDDVDQRLRRPAVGRAGGSPQEDGVQGVGAPLGPGAGQVADERPLAEPLACLGPVGQELARSNCS